MSIIKEIKTKVTRYLGDPKEYQTAVDRLFCFDECYAFKDDKERGFNIARTVARKFNVPVRAVYVAGSAQIGYSFVNSREFIPGKSDLDIAIVDTGNFLRYYELCYRLTNKYRDLTSFPTHGDLDANKVANLFREYLAKGYLRFDYMPRCEERADLIKFFSTLSGEYADKFKKITCGLYLSQVFFSSKQEDIIQRISKVK